MTPATLTVPALPAYVRVASAFVVQAARDFGANPAQTPLFEVAIVEALANAVKHGSRGRDDATVTCEVEGGDGRIRIRIFDQGEGFSFAPRPIPIEPGDIDIPSLPESGYGIPIIQTVFHDIQTCHEDERFCLELHFGGEPAAPAAPVSCP